MNKKESKNYIKLSTDVGYKPGAFVALMMLILIGGAFSIGLFIGYGIGILN